MPTDTFDTPKMTPRPDVHHYDVPVDDTSEDTATLENAKRRSRPQFEWRPIAARVSAALPRDEWNRLKASTGRGLATVRSWSRNSPWRTLDAALVAVWSLAVVLLAIELALAVTPIAGVLVALAAGIAIGAGGRRLLLLVQTRQPRRTRTTA
jgi:hypothetical protein